MDIRKQIKKLMVEQDLDTALTRLFKDYLETKIFFLEAENKQYEEKWKMTFEQFMEQMKTHPDASSYEIEKQIFDWESVLTGIEYYSKLQKQWK